MPKKNLENPERAIYIIRGDKGKRQRCDEAVLERALKKDSVEARPYSQKATLNNKKPLRERETNLIIKKEILHNSF